MLARVGSLLSRAARRAAVVLGLMTEGGVALTTEAGDPLGPET